MPCWIVTLPSCEFFDYVLSDLYIFDKVLKLSNRSLFSQKTFQKMISSIFLRSSWAAGSGSLLKSHQNSRELSILSQLTVEPLPVFVSWCSGHSGQRRIIFFLLRKRKHLRGSLYCLYSSFTTQLTFYVHSA